MRKLQFCVAALLLSCSAGAVDQDEPDTKSDARSGGGGDADVPADFSTVLELHNQERRRLGVAELTWDASLAASAQTWVNGCVASHDPNSTHEGEPFGENIAAGSSGFGADGLAETWLGEGSNYGCATNECSGTCGHYTQVIWADSQELGCAVASCGSGLVLACRYQPAGNVIGQRPIPAANCP